MAKTVVTVEALAWCQTGINSTDPRICAAAESVLSALVLHLRHRKATLPDALDGHVELLAERHGGLLRPQHLIIKGDGHEGLPAGVPTPPQRA